MAFKKAPSQAVQAYRPGVTWAAGGAIRQDISAAPPAISLYPTVAARPSSGVILPGRLQTPLTPSLGDGLEATDTYGPGRPSFGGAAAPTFYDDFRAAAEDFGLGSAGESGADVESAAEDSAIASDAGDGGLVEQLLSTLGSEAAALGMTLQAYATKILQDYPWLGPILGVATGAGLVALFMSLKGDGTTPAAAKKAATKRKKSTKPSYMSKAEWAAWKKARGKSGPISQKEFHSKVWGKLRPVKKKKKKHHHHHEEHHHHKKKKSKKGKRISFMADGKRVSFIAKK